MENTARDPENTWLSIQDAAEQLGVNPRTVRRYIRVGRIDVSRISNKVVRVRQADIDRFMETGVGKTAKAAEELAPNAQAAVESVVVTPAKKLELPRPTPARPAKPAGFTPGRFA